MINKNRYGEIGQPCLIPLFNSNLGEVPLFQFDRAVTICIESLNSLTEKKLIFQGSGRGTDALLCQMLYKNLKNNMKLSSVIRSE